MRSQRFRTVLMALGCGLLPCTAAHASLVNDYTQSDDVWNTPVAPGHSLIDARISYTTSSVSPVLQPAASVVFGLVPGLEGGVWIGDSMTGPAIAFTGGSELLNPYLKYQLPWQVGRTIFGVVGGVQVPAGANIEHDVAVEAVASTQLTSAWTLDFGVGVGQQFVSPASLGHLNVNLAYTWPGGQNVFAEAYAILASNAPPLISQHVGFLLPVTPNWTWDAGIAVNESSAPGASGLSPQLGTTVSF